MSTSPEKFRRIVVNDALSFDEFTDGCWILCTMAIWSGPDRLNADGLEEFARNYEGEEDVQFVVLICEHMHEIDNLLGNRHEFRSTPLTMFVVDGEIVLFKFGVQSQSDFSQGLRQALGKDVNSADETPMQEHVKQNETPAEGLDDSFHPESIWLRGKNSWIFVIIISVITGVFALAIWNSPTGIPARLPVSLTGLFLIWVLQYLRYSVERNYFELSAKHLTVYNHWFPGYKREIPLTEISNVEAKYHWFYEECLRVESQDWIFDRYYGIQGLPLAQISLFCNLIYYARADTSADSTAWMRNPEVAKVRALLSSDELGDQEFLNNCVRKFKKRRFKKEKTSKKRGLAATGLLADTAAKLISITDGQKLSDPEFSEGLWVIAFARANCQMDVFNLLHLECFLNLTIGENSVNFAVRQYEKPQRAKEFVSSDFDLGITPLTLFVSQGKIQTRHSGIVSGDYLRTQIIKLKNL